MLREFPTLHQKVGRAIILTPSSCSFQGDNFQGSAVSCALPRERSSDVPPHLRPARLHLDPLWWTAVAETSEREVYRRAIWRPLVSSAKPTTGVQVVRAGRPRGLDSLTPGAHSAGPLHPQVRSCTRAVA